MDIYGYNMTPICFIQYEGLAVASCCLKPIPCWPVRLCPALSNFVQLCQRPTGQLTSRYVLEEAAEFVGFQSKNGKISVTIKLKAENGQNGRNGILRCIKTM